MIIDAHVHLWNRQHGFANGKAVFALRNGKSMFAGELRQMMPPYMMDGRNTAEMLLSNMDYAGVSGAVVTQEEIDGNQNTYLLHAKEVYSERLKICSLYEENVPYSLDGFDGIKLCAGRLKEQDLTKHYAVFSDACARNKFVSIDLADGGRQTGALQEIITQLPQLRIAVGHFGMVTRSGWEQQIKLARNKNVFVESGGITWLFHNEFYPYPSAIRAVLEAAEICGQEKLMWGSDYPRTMTEITYKMSYDFILKSKDMDRSFKEQFLYQNAEAFYGFQQLEETTKIKNMLED